MAYRVLSLDGGGSWAILQAMALRDIYGDIPSRNILANFDLAVANSGGSITLAGLIENKTPSEICDLFNTEGDRRSIFAPLDPIDSLLSHIPIFPKYSTAGKLAGLTRIFGATGQTPLAHLTGDGWIKGPNRNEVKILIVAFDYDSQRAQFFRSHGTEHGATADPIPLVEAVHASSDAPIVFFDKPTSWQNSRFWDGAMAGLNNPLFAGVVDLLGEGVPANEMVALSIGTGTVKLIPPDANPAPPDDSPLAQPRRDSSTINDLEAATGCITDDPPDMASFSTHVVLASARGADPTKSNAVVRMSPVVRPVVVHDVWSVPLGLEEEEFQSLIKLGMDPVEQKDVDLIAKMGTCWIQGHVRNQPIRMNSVTFDATIGEDFYSEAKTRWVTLAP